MFTCQFADKCKKDEAESRKQHLGNASGLILLLKKATWVPWYRDCHFSCPRHTQYRMEHYRNFLNSDVFKHLMELDVP